MNVYDIHSLSLFLIYGGLSMIRSLMLHLSNLPECSLALEHTYLAYSNEGNATES